MNQRVPTNTADAAEWRRRIHRHPEFGFQETDTAAFVAEMLESFGIEVTRGVGGTGVVGRLVKGSGARRIGLRADMDALRIHEQNTFDHASCRPGLMHACGHDGHTTMLLAAARTLAQDVDFDAEVTFIFQPAEEHGRGAQAMIDDGLFERWRIDEVYGLHNHPGTPLGTFTTRPGPFMAAEDNFEIVLTGQGGHAAWSHGGREVMVAACQLVTALQTIVSRRVEAAEAAVVSTTEITTDGTRNVLPGRAVIRGDCRSFTPQTSALIETEMRRLSEGVASAYGVACEVTYSREFAPTVNSGRETEIAFAAAQAVPGMGVERDCPLSMGAEDFGVMLMHRPGAFAYLGNGVDSAPLHNPRYDFNDAAIPYGVAWFVELVRGARGV